MSAESEIERKLDGPGPNTLIEYMYRDASNYKKTNVAVLKGRISLGQIGLIESSLNDGEFFIPGQVGLQDLQGEFEHGGGWDEDDDHVWHTISSIEYTDQPSNSDLSVDEMMRNWPASSEDWDLVKHLERLSSSLPATNRI